MHVTQGQPMSAAALQAAQAEAAAARRAAQEHAAEVSSLRSELDRLNRQLEQTCTLRLQPNDASDSQVTHLSLLSCLDHYFESVMLALQWVTHWRAWPSRSVAALKTQPCSASQVSCILQVRSWTVHARLRSCYLVVLLSQRRHVRRWPGCGSWRSGAWRS